MYMKHMKRCSTLLIIREMQIKNHNEISPHTSPLSKSLQTINPGESVEKGKLLHCWWECKLMQPLWKMVWRFLKKLRIKPPYDPAIPLVGMYPEDTRVEKDTCILLFTEALFTIAITWKQPRCPLIDEWIERLWYIYTMEYYSAIKRNALDSVLTRWLNLLYRMK